MEMRDEKPPPTADTLRHLVTSRVCAGISEWSSSWLGTLADVRHLSSSNPASRLRHDLALLDPFR